MAILSCGRAKNYLKPFGYSNLGVPKANVRPLVMLGESGGRLTPIGPLAGTFVPGAVPVPEVMRQRVASISGAASEKLDASLGLDILGSAISALAGSTLGMKAAYKDAKQVQFEFGDVMEDYVDVTGIDAFLSSATINSTVGQFLRTALDRDNVYVVTAAVDSRQITVKATAESGSDLSLDVPVVQQLVGGKVSVGSSGSNSSTLTYTSTETPLAFGVKVVRLIYEDGLYRTLKLVKPGGTSLAGTEGESDESQSVPDEEIYL